MILLFFAWIFALIISIPFSVLGFFYGCLIDGFKIGRSIAMRARYFHTYRKLKRSS